MLLKLVKKVTEARDTKSFYFDPSEKFVWESGQYAYLTIEKVTKQFTIASSPTEKFIQITTRIRKESRFKKLLDKVQIGSTVDARGPFGSFILDSSHLVSSYSPVFLAGGIGITPFRSMIKYNIDSKLNIPMYLIYSNSDADFVFKNELDKWQKRNDFIKIHYHNSSISGHLDAQKLNNLISVHFISSVFWVVGPPPFVNAMEDILEELKIPQDHVKTEKFIGY
ncbi:MAG: FAD-dependent oxidoreductase [Candidatus Woesebacteria bacterium]|nr:FAD-dependent oxidoreductase [Candidatus Woesebacteria bacterium]